MGLLTLSCKIPGTGLARWVRRRPIRRLLLLFILAYMLNVARYAVWPPVGFLVTDNPETTSFISYHIRSRNASPDKIQQTWVPLERISPHLRRAVIISEDDTFWQHNGFDWQGLRNAFQHNVRTGRLAAGGSTISQQLAKNLYFTPGKSVTRKLQEAVITWRLERNLSKERILEIYLNVVEWGEGIYGAEAAARHYFKSSAATLSQYQAATLAAMLPSPKNRRPDSAIVKKIANLLVGRMNR